TPRIAVAGLNPHAGESGKLGREEIEIIATAVAQLNQSPITSHKSPSLFADPVSPHTLFHRLAAGEWDAALRMYHDQGLIPLGLQNTFVYRWNYFLRALFGLIPLAGTVFLWRAIFKERGGGLHGYDYGSMIYYYLLALLVSNLVTPTEDEWQIAADIREGQINSFLTKPLSYLGYRFSIFLSGRLVYTAVTLPPIVLIFIYFRHYIALPD